MDSSTHAHYSIPLERQMARIGDLTRTLEQSVQNGHHADADASMLDDAARLISDIDGRPGDGAVEVYRDLDRNTETAQTFVNKWQHITDNSSLDVLAAAQETLAALQEMQQQIADTPEDVMQFIKTGVGRMYPSRRKRFLYAGIAIICFVIAAFFGANIFSAGWVVLGLLVLWRALA